MARDGYREFARGSVHHGVFARGVGHLARVAVDGLHGGGSVDVFIGLPDHVLVKLEQAGGAQPPKNREEDFLEKGILNHTCSAKQIAGQGELRVEG